MRSFRNIRAAVAGTGFIGVVHVEALRRLGVEVTGVVGSRASAAWRAERPEELWIGHRDRPSEILLRDPGQLLPHAAAHTSMPAGHSEGFGETFRELYRAVYTAVAAGEPPAQPNYPTFADGHEQSLVGDAIARSHVEGRWVAVER